MYTELQAEGFKVEYARVPITDGKAPKSPDFDALARNIVQAGKDAALVFNCQVRIFPIKRRLACASCDKQIETGAVLHITEKSDLLSCSTSKSKNRLLGVPMSVCTLVLGLADLPCMSPLEVIFPFAAKRFSLQRAVFPVGSIRH